LIIIKEYLRKKNKMKKLTSESLRDLYLKFFESKGHKIIPSSSLIPENDPTVLFTTAGMHPLVPYLLGEKHPEGTRLTDVQKCVRTGDIDEVGDNSHCTFFEMLGNWSLGDYFKKESISWSYEFLTSEEYLAIPKEDIAISVFAGDENAPRDTESAQYWKNCGIAEDKIFYLPKENNWWGPAGITGPCGPDTEIFIDRGMEKCSDNCSPACDCGKYIEIWNNVFMQYFKNAEGNFEPLKKKNVDTGMGLERTLCIINGVKSVYETDIFKMAISKIEEITSKKYNESEEITKAFRIILDHTRTATFMIGDVRGISPSNVDQGYILRRIIRRAVRYGRQINLPEGSLSEIAKTYIEKYKNVYTELATNSEKIINELNMEELKFSKTLIHGLKEFEKVTTNITFIDGKTAFRLYDTFGFPIEITVELANEKRIKVDTSGFNEAFAEHQAKSQAGSEQRFKGGLADSREDTARLHTATHLLQAGLRKICSPDIHQKGSNITAERLRFDFNFSRPLTAEEIKEVENFVNNAIETDVPVVLEEMTVAEAKEQGATGLFESKYGERVKVYTMGEFSKEICGGPHASSTGELGKFKITKEQSSSSGIRRIKAELNKD
jgi:alanyl-tRNA synthetase